MRLALAVQGPLGQACQDLAISRRYLERLGRTHFGMAPKRFQTIARLQQALLGAAHTGGADLALQMGHHDQSHLARDLRRLAGQPLGTLVQQARRATAGGTPRQTNPPCSAGVCPTRCCGPGRQPQAGRGR